ncbi:MAG TPA: HEAT repeat domain-containing protein [Candidatus Eisenbacteria bacterium]|nr:HEAT repeat domain-containing protein [Candidatus Eisenbacteria bacterium]
MTTPTTPSSPSRPSPAPSPAGKPGSPEQRADRIRDQVLALDVKRVADWIGALVRTIKATRTYLSNNPTLHKFQVELESRTWSCLKEAGDITLVVQQFDLLYENYSVYHNADRNDSLAFRFYGDGVRVITFREGLEPHELRAFIDVLKRSMETAQVQDDVVTLLWERDFRHIEYQFIPLEDLTEESGEILNPEDEELAVSEGGGIPWPSGFAPSSEDEMPAQVVDVAPEQSTDAPTGEASTVTGPTRERSDDWEPTVHAAPAYDSTIGVQFGLTDEENATLEVSIREEEGRQLGREVLEIVATILAHEDTPAGFLDSATAFQRFIELAIEEGEVARANDLVARLRSIAADCAKKNAEFPGLAEQVVREVGRPSFLGLMAPTLNARPEIDPGILTNFLVQLGPSAAPAICDLLGQVNQMKFRRALCEALAISCKNDVEVLIERLGDTRWYVIRNIVYVLGRIAHQGVERALDRALHHEDVRVRKEAVRALGNIESPTSRAYLVSAFRDTDAGVRIQAAMTLAMRRDDRASQSLLGVIQGTEFGRRDTNERQAFFEALGRCGSDALVPRLDQMLTKGGLFRSSNEEERLHAALALAWLGTPNALQVLNREITSKREPIRKAVETALSAVRNAGLATKDPAPGDEEDE